MAIAFDANLGTATVAGVSQTTLSLTTSAAAASGSTVLLAVGWDSTNGATLSSVSGGGLAWAVDKQKAAAFATARSVGIASAAAPSGLASGTTITATFSVADKMGLIAAVSFAGIASTSSVDVTGSNSSVGSTAWSAGGTTVTLDTVVFAAAVAGVAATSTPTSPYTEVQDFQDATFAGTLTTTYNVESTAGFKLPAGTWSVSGVWASALVAYKDATPHIFPAVAPRRMPLGV